MNKQQITTAALLGEAVGDAFGVPYEFLPRKIVRLVLNADEMIGCDSLNPLKTKWGEIIPSGAWSDDTSMTLASFVSFIEQAGNIDYSDHLRRFVSWWNDSQYCSTGFAFGLGGNVSKSLQRFLAGANALECGGTGLNSNGNGSLMRILPFSLFCIFNGLDQFSTKKVISDASSITHAHDISKLSCCVWTEFLRKLIETRELDAGIAHIESLDYSGAFSCEAIDALSFVWNGQVLQLAEDDINETGYVVDTLKSALYSLINSDDYKSSIVTTVELGYDTDTSAAVTGAAAGLLYGVESIPEKWVDKLLSKDVLVGAAVRFASLF